MFPTLSTPSRPAGREKKNVVLVRADPGASAFSASRLGTAPTKRGHLDMHGPVVSRCSSCAVPGANTTRGDPRALPARGPGATTLDTVYVHGKFSKTRAYSYGMRGAPSTRRRTARSSHVGLGRRMTDRRRERRRLRAGTLTDWHLLRARGTCIAYS